MPPGDPQRGVEAFRDLHCDQCHSVPDALAKRADSLYPDVEVVLGGEVYRVKTYGELVTAIIHPSKAVTRRVPSAALIDEDTSIMPIYNRTMTVEQLVDLTTFLQDSYQLVPPRRVPAR